MTDLAEPFVGELANEFYMRLIDSPGVILKIALVTIALIRLRMLPRPGANLVFIDTDLVVLDPGVELWQRFAVVVLADTGIETIVPAVHTADQVITGDVTVGMANFLEKKACSITK